MGRKSFDFEHFWYNTWPDHGVPRTARNPVYTDDCVRMVVDVTQYVRKRAAKMKKTDSLVLVHCSAGIGRTGTYISLDHSIYAFEKRGNADPIDIIDNVRKDRCALVQHPVQFKFVHAGAVRYAALKEKECNVESTGLDMQTMTRKAKMSEEAKKHRREKEKQAAMARIQAAKSGGDDGDMGRLIRKTTASDGELDLGFISFEGNDYGFVDPDGNGVMDLAEAKANGFPRALFKLLDSDRDGKITPGEFKRYQRDVRRAARASQDQMRPLRE